MSVFKEAFAAVEVIRTLSSQVYMDSCDYGAPTKKGCGVWKSIKTLHSYLTPEELLTVKKREDGGSFLIELIHEFGPNKGASTTYEVAYTKLDKRYKHSKNLWFLGADGFTTVSVVRHR